VGVGVDVRNFPAVAPCLATGLAGSLEPSDFQLFGSLKKYLADKWLEADTNVKQAVTSCLQTYHSDLSVPKDKP
jgi:hypothetical protein